MGFKMFVWLGGLIFFSNISESKRTFHFELNKEKSFIMKSPLWNTSEFSINTFRNSFGAGLFLSIFNSRLIDNLGELVF